MEESRRAVPHPSQGDGTLLAILVRNLVDNAVRYSPPSARVKVGVQQKSGRVVLSVEDSGPGIPASVLPHLFEPFFTTKPCGAGLGLGLVICAAIVREFGSSLRACNVDQGAAFEFAIPLAPSCEDHHNDE